MVKKMIAVLSLVFLCACSSKVTQQNYQKVQTNMTFEQVTEILGTPSKQTAIPLGALSINAATWMKGNQKIVVQFLDNKVAFKNYATTTR